MPFLGVYSWNQFSVPAGIPAADLLFDTHANDAASPSYSPGATEWLGKTFTFDGGAATQIEITDDDNFFEDGYVETGAPQTLTTGVTIDGTFYAAGSVVQNEFSMIDAGGNEVWIVAINGQNVGFAYADGAAPILNETFTGDIGLDGDPADNADGTSSSSEPYSGIICFAEGTHIETPDGPKRVEDLRRGSLIRTQDSGDQALQWVGRTRVPLTRAAEKLHPVVMPAGSLGNGLPARDLLVSQQHRMLIDVDAAEMFAPAKGLTPLKGVRLKRGLKTVTYYHLLLPRHAVIYAEGVRSESFYPGASALRMMGVAQLRQVLGLYPGAAQDALGVYGPLARPCLSVRKARDWARRVDDVAQAFAPVPAAQCEVMAS